VTLRGAFGCSGLQGGKPAGCGCAGSACERALRDGGLLRGAVAPQLHDQKLHLVAGFGQLALQATAAEGAAQGHAARTMLAVASADTLDERFHTLERTDEIESLLLEIKQRQPL
jgi:hypothetical protein